jgi:hypothetical protein
MTWPVRLQFIRLVESSLGMLPKAGLRRQADQKCPYAADRRPSMAASQIEAISIAEEVSFETEEIFRNR